MPNPTLTRMYAPAMYATLKRIQYKDWILSLEAVGEFFGIRIRFYAPCAITGEHRLQTGRLWILEDPITEDSIIKTVFAAIKACEEHEMMEFFKVDGVPPFSPHTSITEHKKAFTSTFAQEQ